MITFRLTYRVTSLTEVLAREYIYSNIPNLPEVRLSVLFQTRLHAINNIFSFFPIKTILFQSKIILFCMCTHGTRQAHDVCKCCTAHRLVTHTVSNAKLDITYGIFATKDR